MHRTSNLHPLHFGATLWVAALLGGCGASSLHVDDAQGRLWISPVSVHDQHIGRPNRTYLDRAAILGPVDRIGGGTVATKELAECEGEGFVSESDDNQSSTSTNDSNGIGRAVLQCLEGVSADVMLRVQTLRAKTVFAPGLVSQEVLMNATVEVPKEAP